MNATLRKDTGLLGATTSLIVPESLRYVQPKCGPPGTRKEIRLPAVASSYSTGGDNIVRFFLSSDGLLDFRRGYLSFDFRINTGVGVGTYLRVSQGIWSIFNRLRLVCGGKELEDIREYNLYNSLMFEALQDTEISDVIGPSCYGYATQAQRNVFSSATKTYSCPILCGFFLTGVLPMAFLKQRLELQLYLEDVSRCIETDYPIGLITMTLSNVYFHTEELKLESSVARELEALVNSGVTYPYKKFTHYVQPILNTMNNLVIPHVGAGIETLIHVMRNGANLSNPIVNDKLLSYVPNNTTDFQLRINNELYPPEKTLTTTPQAYVQYLRYINKWKLGGVYRNPPSISSDEYNTNRFIIVNQLETYPGESLVNNLSTESAGTNMYLVLNLAVPPALNTQLDTFVQSYGVICFCGGKLE